MMKQPSDDCNNIYLKYVRCTRCQIWIPKDRIEQYTKPPSPKSKSQKKRHCKICGMMIKEKSHHPRVEKKVKRI